MDKPKVVDTAPAILQLEPGTYSWCQCGLSATQPFCDGSHAGTAFAPVTFELTTAKRVSLCMCKATGKPPYCDGSHCEIEE